MMIINLLGIDIAKNMFQLHGVDYSGKAVLKKRLSRGKLVEYIANIPPWALLQIIQSGLRIPSFPSNPATR